MSMFRDVSSLNEAFGNPVGNPLRPNWETIKNQSKNILDEYNELMEAIQEKDLDAVRDAICDILVFTLGAGHIAGVPVDEDMAAVDQSNRSKFCANEEQVQATVAKYNALGLEVVVDGEFPLKRVKSPRDQTDVNGKADYRKGKMLKCVKFQEPVFRPIVSGWVDPVSFVPYLETHYG